tara:strand:- start:4457 stop:5323 length:867 start_codon:yes stop_codon:yes gene_type:complete
MKLAQPFLILIISCGIATAETDQEETFIPNYAAGSVHWLWTETADFDGPGDGSLGVTEAGISAPFPIVTTEDLRIIGGVRYRWNQLKLDGFDPIGDELDLHRVQIPINFWKTGQNGWKYWVRLEPGISSDFKKITGDDFTVSALGLASYQWKEDVRIALGGYFSRDLGEARLLPAVGLIWEPNQHWVLSITAPRLYASYAPFEGTLFTAFAYPSGGGWNIEDPATGEERDLDYQAVQIGLGLDQALFGALWAYIEGGYQVARELEIEGGSQVDLENSWWAGAGLRLRF